MTCHCTNNLATLNYVVAPAIVQNKQVQNARGSLAVSALTKHERVREKREARRFYFQPTPSDSRLL